MVHWYATLVPEIEAQAFGLPEPRHAAPFAIETFGATPARQHDAALTLPLEGVFDPTLDQLGRDDCPIVWR